MGTPSQATNGLISGLRGLAAESPASEWEACLASLREQRAAWTGNRQEFRERGEARGPEFGAAAAARSSSVEEAYSRYGAALEHLYEACEARRADALAALTATLERDTVALFTALDDYAAFHFSWSEGQSPLVTVIRQAVENYSRRALQSAQAQRIWQDMQTHLGLTEEIQTRREEGSS